jgi:anti-anti-sigma factor
MADAAFEINVDCRGGRIAIEVNGELDLATASSLRDAIRAIPHREVSTVVVDIAGVTFVDSTGLHALLDSWQWLAARDVRMNVVGPQPAAARLFELADVETVLLGERRHLSQGS